MKKLVIFAAFFALIGAFGCDDGGTAQGTLAVTVDYAVTEYDFGAEDTSDSDEYTGKVHVLVWSADATIENGRTETVATAEITTDNGEATLTLDEGSYKVLALYNYKSNSNGLAGKNEYYSFYSDAAIPGDATNVTISKDTPATAVITIDDDYQFGSDSVFATP